MTSTEEHRDISAGQVDMPRADSDGDGGRVLYQVLSLNDGVRVLRDGVLLIGGHHQETAGAVRFRDIDDGARVVRFCVSVGVLV